MISAKVVAHSKSMVNGKELASLEVVMPRFILAEFNTHRMFSRNSASSRAIPFKRMIKSIKENMFYPIAFQRDHKGMQGTKYMTGWRETFAICLWWLASRFAIFVASIFNWFGVTKQLSNRLVEPFMYHKVLVTATEWDNFFDLRCPKYELMVNGVPHYYTTKTEFLEAWRLYHLEHKTAVYKTFKTPIDFLMVNKGMSEIHMMEVAEAIYFELKNSKPEELMAGEWHLPYADDIDVLKLRAVAGKLNLAAFDVRIRISVARCARTSYTVVGDGFKDDYESDVKLFDNLRQSKHYSPFEHVAEVMYDDEIFSFPKGQLEYDYLTDNSEFYDEKKDDGVEKVRFYPIGNEKTADKYGWCYNYCGFKQLRYHLTHNHPIL